MDPCHEAEQGPPLDVPYVPYVPRERPKKLDPCSATVPARWPRYAVLHVAILGDVLMVFARGSCGSSCCRPDLLTRLIRSWRCLAVCCV